MYNNKVLFKYTNIIIVNTCRRRAYSVDVELRYKHLTT